MFGSRKVSNSPIQLSPIKAMEIAASRISGAVSLAQGIPSFPTPKIITDFVIEKIKAGACDHYSLTPGLPELREEVSAALRAQKQYFDAHSEIIITVGAIEGITASILAVGKPGSEIIIPSPSYTSYQGAIKLAKCKPRFVRLNEERNFDLDINAIESKINHRSKAILICNPNNPNRHCI